MSFNARPRQKPGFRGGFIKVLSQSISLNAGSRQKPAFL